MKFFLFYFSSEVTRVDSFSDATTLWLMEICCYNVRRDCVKELRLFPLGGKKRHLGKKRWGGSKKEE